MKKTVLQFLVLLCGIILIPENVLAGQIQVTGIDPMGSPFTNGQTNVSELDGTLFFDTATGASSSNPFTIENTDFVNNLNISSITITGTNASDFRIEDTPPTLIAPGGNEVIFIAFAPQTTGTKNAVVTIVSDDATNGTFTFAIQGTAFEGATGLHFDGENDNITFNNGNYSLNEDFTIEFWIKPDISGTKEHYILDNKSGSAGYSLSIDMMSQLNFAFFTSGGINYLSTSPIVNDKWQHVAIIYNGAHYRIYIDGIEENSLTLSEAIVESSNNLTMGSVSGGTGYYAGAIDEFRVWDTALSSCRISDQYSCQLTGSEDDLIAYYNFNSGEVNGNNFPMYSILDPNHTITSGIPPQGTLNNFNLTGTTSNWIDATANGVTGTCSTYEEAVIELISNDNTISNGDETVSSDNNTSWGDVILGQAEPVDYIIGNPGNVTLSISNISIEGSSDFSIIESPTTVDEGASETLRILFSPSTIGTKSATVSILNDDCDDATFSFAIEGTGYIPATGISLDGTDDHISINHNSAFNTNTFTVEGYFKSSSTSNENPIISKFDATNNNGFSVQLSTTGRLQLYYQGSNIASTMNSTTSGLNDGNWHYFSIVFGNDAYIFYIDGALDRSGTFQTTPNAPTNSENAFIGYSSYTNTYFSGELDDIRFWSRTLCSEEITAQQSCELSGNESGLVAYYNLNEGKVDVNNSGKTTADDASSNNLDGTLLNFELTGSTSNWIDASANGISGTCTVAIPEINVQGDGNDILNGDTSPESDDNTDAGSVNVGSTTEMNFFVRNTEGSATLNVSGIILTGDTDDFEITQNPNNNPIPATESAALTIAFTPTSGGTKTATVIIDSDDCDESTYTFTIQGEGIPPGTGLDFDGSDDMVSIPHNASQNNLNFSVDFWIKTTDGLGGVINKFTPDGNNGWRINLDGGRIEFYYYADASNYITRLLSPETKVDDGDWHHVAVTLDNGNARCYIDGVLARSTGWVGTAAAATTTADIQIGYAAVDSPSGDTGGNFDGELDELRIWTKTLTEYEVSQLNGCTADMSQNNLLASYNFNVGIAEADNRGLTTLTDGSGNNFNGTLINFELTGSTGNWIDASSNNVSGSCDCVVAGDVMLTTQTEVDNFTASLGTCGIIEGDVTITGTITDLSGFSNVHIISGNLHLEGNISDDLTGFSNLTTVGGNLTLTDMPNITSIAAFANIVSIGGNMEIDNLDALTEISSFDQITSIQNITITGNATVSTIAYSQLQTISGNVTITFNSGLNTLSVPVLTEITGNFQMNNMGSGFTDLTFPMLKNTGNLTMADMPGVTTVYMPELETSGGNVSISSCEALTTINWPELSSITGNLSIDNCTVLDAVSTPLLTSVGNNVEFNKLHGLTSLGFLQQLTGIVYLSITDLTSLNNLQDFGELTGLDRLNITNCDNITSLEGFAKLNITSLESLNLYGNSGITTLDNSFLESLTSIGKLGISFNENLTDISALQNVTALTSTDDASTIRNNTQLLSIDLFGLQNVTNTLQIMNQANTTGLCGLYNYVHNGNGSTTLSFSGTNPTDWDSVQDILDNCGTPVITLIGDNPQNIVQGDGYTELGAMVNDGSDVIIDASAFVDAIGSYDITYNAVGVSGNNAVEVIRTVNVVDIIAPVITLTGNNPQVIELGDGYTELGASTDDGSDIIIDASDFVDAVGSYTITYNATDDYGNTATQVTRTVNVVDTTAPVISLTGDNPQVIELGDGYTELGAIADDGSDIVIDASDFVDVVGSYVITYNATDDYGNTATQVTRTVNVVDTTAPVISLTGDNPQVIELGDGYTELGAIADDGSDIVIDASSFVDAVGSYTITYNATDAYGNTAAQITRTVNVVDTTAPVISLTGDNPQEIQLGSGYVELGATTDDGSQLTIDSSEFVDELGNYTIYYNATDAYGNTATQVTRTVNVILATTLSDYIFGDVYLYPNPTQDWFEIKGLSNNQCQLEIYNVSGQPVKLIKEYKSERVSILHLEPGVYLVKLSEGSNSKILKVLKQD